MLHTYETVPAGAEAGRGRRAGGPQSAQRAAACAASAAAQGPVLQRACNKLYSLGSSLQRNYLLIYQ